MLSIKRLLNADPETDGTMLRVAQTLLEAIGQHAIECNREDHQRFQQAMEQVAAVLEECDSRQARVAGDGAVRALEEYTRKVANHLRARSGELKSMVQMLTAAVAEITTAGEENVSRLRGIEGQISTAIQVDDIRVIRSQMAECLVEIRKETERQKTLASTAAERMRLDLDRARTGVTSDSVTGLQVRTKGMEMLTTACETEQSAFAAVMVIDRLQHVNASSGAEAGDQLLRYFAGHVRRNLPPADWLFRWTGASLLALLYRAKSLEKVREEMSQLMNAKLECTVRTPTRSIRLPVTARWTLFPMMASPPALIQKIDEFAATLNVTD